MKKKESKHHDRKKNNNHLRDRQNERTQKRNSVRGFTFGVLTSLYKMLVDFLHGFPFGLALQDFDHFRCGTFLPVAHFLSFWPNCNSSPT